VRVNGKEIASKALGEEKVSASLVVEPNGSLTIRAFWSGLSSPDREDWVGVFPVGGDDRSRLAFEFTGGKKEGSLILTVPPRSAADQYEVRLYRAAGWDLVTTSAPLVPQAARPK